MSATLRHHADGNSSATADAGSTSTTPAKQGRARHARTNASLTSSSGNISVDAPSSFDRMPRRPSVPNEATRIFQATGFDPFGTEPDTLFRSLTVKEVEAYERAVRTTASGKQEELRSLVGQRYEDLLGTANTIIDMAGSSKQLSQRLHELSDGVRLAALTDNKSASSVKTNRRKSFLPTQHLPAPEAEAEASSLHQEAIYVLGASLRLIMDAPEYVWKSIERGKTLQAAWAFMLARATWWDLIDSSSSSGAQSTLAADGEAGISSVSEAVSLLKVNVKKAFPFIEKQVQTLLPMRKQIVHRAVSLLSDSEIESIAVVDQLAALMLLDGTKPEQAKHLLLSQRLTAMRRMVQQRQTKPASHHRAQSRHTTAHKEGEAAVSKEERAAQTSQTISQLVTLFARTLQHAIQIFMLPSKAPQAASASRPLLLDLLNTVTDPANFASGAPAAGSPSSERTFLLPHSSPNSDAPTARQNAAALRAQRRRSSYGLPAAEGEKQVESEAQPDCTQTHPNWPSLRVSTLSVVEALPSGRILSRLLSPSVWGFTPHLDHNAKEASLPSPSFADLASWATKARETIVRGSDNAAPVSVRSLLSELSDVGELALARSSLRVALRRARRIVARKLAGAQGSTDERRDEAVRKIHSELRQLEEAIDAVFQERLLHLMEQKLNRAVKELLEEAERIVSSLDKPSESQDDESTRVDAPLDALFHPIEAENTRSSTASSSSRTFTAALQDHVCGRSKQMDRLASLYEAPLATISEELQLYRAELEADERFAGASDSIRAKFDSILASSRAEVETGLTALLEQAQTSSKAAGGQAQVSRSTLLGMRIIAVLDGTASSGHKVRGSVKAALERFWRPQLEQRISHLLKVDSVNSQPASDATSSTVSASMLCALATLSESIVQLGPALGGPELADQVRGVLVALAESDAISAGDSTAIRALLACDASSLSRHIAADTSLHRIRLALAPLVLALATTASGTQEGSETRTMARVLSPAEPASAMGAVRPILTVSRKKVDRFSLLPVR